MFFLKHSDYYLGLRVGFKPAIFGGLGFGLFSAAIEYALNSRT